MDIAPNKSRHVPCYQSYERGRRSAWALVLVKTADLEPSLHHNVSPWFIRLTHMTNAGFGPLSYVAEDLLYPVVD